MESSGIPKGSLPPLLLALDLHWTTCPECDGALEHYATEERSVVQETVLYCKCLACNRLIEVVVKY